MKALSTRVLLAVLPVGTLAGQQPAENFALRLPYYSWGGAMALDPTTARPVQFGGGDNSIGPQPFLWEWTGDTWARHVAVPGPDLRTGHAMATHEQSHQLVLFGGSSLLPRDTWTWDGVRWQAHATPLLLTMRTDFPMAYDSARGRVVLFSGNGAPNDTWEWDGISWNLRQPGAPPSARSGHRMAFDAARGKTVLFGGHSSSSVLNDTWEWDGTFWTQRFPAQSPSARSQAPMAYDPLRQRVVLFGGGSAQSLGLADTWEWDGSNWRLVTTAHSPRAPQVVTSVLGSASLLFDRTRNRVVLFSNDPTGEVWEYDGVDWSRVVAGSAPPPRYLAAMTDDPPRGSALLFGGRVSSTDFGDTWTWDGRRWAQATLASAPGARAGHGLAFDAAHGVAVLFGGQNYASSSTLPPYDDTWTWNGAWTQAQPAHRPPTRWLHGLAYHAPSQRIVLFGGYGGTTLLGDTWTWDGIDWHQENPAVSPPPRYLPQMAGTAQPVVLFGGAAWTTNIYNSVPLGDTWTWDGVNWTQQQPATSPPARYEAGCAYDADRGRVLVFSGLPIPSSATAPGDTWAFDGTNWTQLTTATMPLVRYGHSLTYDPRLHELVLSGGIRFSYQNDTWTLRSAAVQTTFGSGCPGALGTPSLQTSPDSVPEPGGAVIADVTNLPSSLAVMAGGFSDTRAGAQPLPLALDPFGMPGCNLLVSPDATVLLAGSANAATWTLPLPFATGLLGVGFYYQAFAFDAGANAAGLTTSNGGRCRIGN